MRTASFPLISIISMFCLLGCVSGDDSGIGNCGDGIVEPGEECDDSNISPGDGCSENCHVEEGYVCRAAQPSTCQSICGDSVVLDKEDCDGHNLDGASCESLGLGSGVLSCDGNCRFDLSGCDTRRCGNNTIDPGESCDGTDLGDHDCVSAGYDAGTVACTGLCELDHSGCTRVSCGNGIIEQYEGCDDMNSANGDGCSANCDVESGWECHEQPSQCSPRCGNQHLDISEQCDGDNLGGQSCLTLDYSGGTLACGEGCVFDTSGCTMSTCGNGQLDQGEQCDAELLDGGSCTTLGFVSGTVACADNCSYDTSECIPNTCGDGHIAAGEACDDGDQTPGDGCNANCNVEAGWDCESEPSDCQRLCGNGTLDLNERCDGEWLDEATCQSLDFNTGQLACTENCTFDTSGCSMFSCNNGTLEPGEECDGDELAGLACEDLDFVAGTLSCTQNCTLDTSQCVAPTCGDGIISPQIGEQCDDRNTGNEDGCNANCQVEVGHVCHGQPSVCELSCGNGVPDPGEDCDGLDVGDSTCVSLGYAGGALSCLQDCHWDSTQCLVSICGNTTVESGEDCDGVQLGGADCTTFDFAGGTLSCTEQCSYNTTSCTLSVCGNGALEGGEECDDGGTGSGDGCSSGCVWENVCSSERTLACGQDSDDVYGLSNDVSGYSCGGLNGSYEDRIYSHVATTSGNAEVFLDVIDNIDDDFDLYVLEGGCHPELCLAYSTSWGDDEVSFHMTAGLTYFIVVEVYDNWGWGDYSLSLSCP